MKRNIIATLIGTLIVFLWQGFSWMASPIHTDSMKYTPKQAEITEAISANLTEDGMYRVPGFDPSEEMTTEKMEAFNKEYEGKPWALVLYNKSFVCMGPSVMVNGILLNLVGVILAICVFRIARGEERKFGTGLLLIMALPLFTIFQSALMNANWWSFPWHFLKGEVIDLIVGWLLFGLFAVWYFRRKPKTA
jgi:hypothetical protein